MLPPQAILRLCFSCSLVTGFVLCLAKSLSVPEINSLHNFLNRKICYDDGACSTSLG
jgi:hypothetical protein